MKIKPTESVESNPVDMEGASGVAMRLLVSDADGAPNFTMRQFVVEPGGHTPKHTHPYEHEVYVVSGSGVALEGDVEHAITGGDVVFVRPGEVHQFRNSGDSPMTFLCLIPNSAAGQPVTPVPDCCG
jgi:quercetin dioxygenase-like cupin family protein